MRPFITWLASYPKTGSTWVRSMLNAYYYGEGFDPNRMDVVRGEPLNSFYLGMWTQAKPWDFYDWACMRNVALVQQQVVYRQIPEYYAIKTHAANVQVHDVSLISPVYTKAAIYVARDPRDVLVSGAKYFRRTYSSQWKLMQDEQAVINRGEPPLVWHVCSSYGVHLQSWLGTPLAFPVLRVLYEDMLENPRREFLQILQFLGVKPDPQLVDLALKLSSFKSMQAFEARHGFRENVPASSRYDSKEEPASPFFRAGKAAQWRTELPKDLADEVYEALKPLENLWGNPRKPVGQAD